MLTRSIHVLRMLEQAELSTNNFLTGAETLGCGLWGLVFMHEKGCLSTVANNDARGYH